MLTCTLNPPSHRVQTRPPRGEILPPREILTSQEFAPVGTPLNFLDHQWSRMSGARFANRDYPAEVDEQWPEALNTAITTWEKTDRAMPVGAGVDLSLY